MTASSKSLISAASREIRELAGGRFHPGDRYTEEVADEIVERISGGEPLTRVVKFDRMGNRRPMESFPGYATIRAWAIPTNVRQYRPTFAERFAQARLDQHSYWIEETIEIADTPEMSLEEVYEESEKHGVSLRRVRKDNVSSRQLRIFTRFQAAAKLDPVRWADRLQKASEDAAAVAEIKTSRLIIEGGLPDDDDPPPPATPPVEET